MVRPLSPHLVPNSTRLTANADTLSPFDGSYRCLKEINYPKSFSALSSPAIGLDSVPASPTSVRVQSQRTLPHSSCLLLRLPSRLFSEHRRMAMPQVTTRDMFNPFSLSCSQVLVYSRSILCRTGASFLRNVPSCPFCRVSGSPIPPPFHRPENGGDPDEVMINAFSWVYKSLGSQRLSPFPSTSTSTGTHLG